MNEQKPVAWMVRNGVVDYQLVKRKEQADYLVADLQKRHDLSGSLSHFNAVALYTHPNPAPDLANDFNPDWDVVAPMVEEQQRMAKRIEELEAALRGDVEPVAWMSPDKERLEFSRADTVYGTHTIPLYAHPAPDLLQALKIISVWAKNGSCQKDFGDIEKLANETINKAQEAGL